MYMYCRSSTRYCRPQEVSNPRRFIRYHTLPTPNAINLRPFQLPKVTAAVYVLPKSILPPIHSHSTLLSHSLDILLVKVKGSSRSGICLAEALSDTATPAGLQESHDDEKTLGDNEEKLDIWRISTVFANTV
uniref:(northern house mosquito) hypothetical protein n=1 Tax=Culex pipiens TaxID=7175 RepID=A0A8D8DYW0_CULPI